MEDKSNTAQERETGTEIEMSGPLGEWLSCIPRVRGRVAQGSELSALLLLLPTPLLLRQRQAKGGGGATDLAVNRHCTAVGRR